MAQVTTLRNTGVMGPVHASFAGKTPADAGGITVAPRVEDERLVRPAGKLT